MTMQIIQHVELSSPAASITFSSIGTSWDDLYILYSLRGTGAGAGSTSISAGLLINGSGGSTRRLQGNGSSVASVAITTGDLYPGEFPGSTATANTFGNSMIYIPNYKSTVAKNVMLDATSEHNGTTGWQQIFAGLSSSTAAVTSITIRVYNAEPNISFAAGSSATLYGILRGSDGITTVS